MAARTRKIRHSDEVRAKIQASQLINFLQDHVLKNRDAKKTQITAALGLLKKTIPDLQSIEGAFDLQITKHEQALNELDE